MFSQDADVVGVLLGSVAAGIVARLVKNCVKQARPAGCPAGSEDPGMPSSHAVLFAYFAASLWLRGPYHGVIAWSPSVGAVGLAVARVRSKHHTAAQVVCGLAVGVLCAGVWSSVLPWLHPPISTCLDGAQRPWLCGALAVLGLALLAANPGKPPRKGRV